MIDHFAVAESSHPVAAHAVGEVCGSLGEALGDSPAGAMVWVGGGLRLSGESIMSAIRRLLRPEVVIGALLGDDADIGSESGGDRLVVWATRSDSVLGAVSLHGAREPTGIRVVGTRELVDALGTLVLLGHPGALPVDATLDRMRARAPQLNIVGGFGGRGAAALLGESGPPTNGLVGMHFDESLPVRVAVAQGVRPVGEPMAITAGTGTEIGGLAGAPAADRLRSTISGLDDFDRRLAGFGLHLGIVVDGRGDEFGRGDFRVVEIAGLDGRGGVVPSTPAPDVGTLVQFAVVDPASAHADLQEILGLAGGARSAIVFGDADRARASDPLDRSDGQLVEEWSGARNVAELRVRTQLGPLAQGPTSHVGATSVALFGGSPSNDVPTRVA